MEKIYTIMNTMVNSPAAFFAYPAKPNELSDTIQTAINLFNVSSSNFQIIGWQKNDISGVPLTDPIFTNISEARFICADVTFLNENVTFEIGYAVGLKKRCMLFRNTLYFQSRDLASKVGIFDTLGYENYENSPNLLDLLRKQRDYTPHDFTLEINRQQPVYIVEPSKRSDALLTLISRTKKARWKYRSFNPDEEVRLSAHDAIRHVSQSAGVIAPLFSDSFQDAREHNLRALFVAGLSLALAIPTLIIHSVEYSPPLDVRDLTKKFRHPDDIADAIQNFSLEITDFIQSEQTLPEARGTLLASVSVGDPTAENEMTTLQDYYLPIGEFQRAARGEVNLVVGRKGSGKTALFISLRDTKRKNKSNIVVDLKPEGYQFVKLKERVLDYLTAGAQQHLITALWQYILLLEIAYKVLEKDQYIHLHNQNLTDRYRTLRELYGETELSLEGDFRERLLKLSNSLIHEFKRKFALSVTITPSTERELINITTDQVTEVLYKHDIKKLLEALHAYLSLKREVWLLFDNIDKGWSVEGVGAEDIFVLRCLIDASRKLERNLNRRGIDFHSIVFVRDDVYSLLMKGSADYGKEMRASLDWSDKDLLAQVLKERITFSLGNGSGSEFAEIWPKIAVSHFSGVPSLEFMVDQSLMRPRNLIKIFRSCLGYAVNFSHERIEADDIVRGLRAYSQDLLIEVDREISDVFPAARKIIYEFSEENSEFTQEDLSTLIELSGVGPENANKIINFLIYYGVLGVYRANEDVKYIYDVNYDIEMLKVRIRKWGESTKYVVNPALWPALNLTYENQPSFV